MVSVTLLMIWTLMGVVMECERCKEKMEDNVYKVAWSWDNKEKDGPYCQQVSSFKYDAFFCANCVEKINNTILNGATDD